MEGRGGGVGGGGVSSGDVEGDGGGESGDGEENGEYPWFESKSLGDKRCIGYRGNDSHNPISPLIDTSCIRRSQENINITHCIGILEDKPEKDRKTTEDCMTARTTLWWYVNKRGGSLVLNRHTRCAV